MVKSVCKKKRIDKKRAFSFLMSILMAFCVIFSAFAMTAPKAYADAADNLRSFITQYSLDNGFGVISQLTDAQIESMVTDDFVDLIFSSAEFQAYIKSCGVASKTQYSEFLKGYISGLRSDPLGVSDQFPNLEDGVSYSDEYDDKSSVWKSGFQAGIGQSNESEEQAEEIIQEEVDAVQEQGYNDIENNSVNNSIWNLLSDAITQAIGDLGLADLSGLMVEAIEEVLWIEQHLAVTPEEANSAVYDFIYTLSNNVVLPIAGAIIAFVLAYEIYEIVCTRNNMSEIGSGTFIQLFLKMAIGILLVVNAWPLVMGLFDLVVALLEPVFNTFIGMINSSVGVQVITASGEVNSSALESAFYSELTSDYLNSDPAMFDGLAMVAQTWILDIAMRIMDVIAFIIIYARVIEIWLVASVAPIPLATMLNREWGQIFLGYVRMVVALAFQAFLILAAVCIWAMLLLNFQLDRNGALEEEGYVQYLWGCVGYTVLLIYALFKTGSLSKAIFNAR